MAGRFPFLQTLTERPGFLAWLFGFGVLFRAAILMISGQLQTDFYWEYGLIAENLMLGKGYQFPFTDSQLNFLKDQTYPSALMPPGYVFFLIPFLAIRDTLIRNLLLFGSQILLQSGAIVLAYKTVLRRLGKPMAMATAALQLFTPDLAYACSTAGPTVWFHFLLSLFFWLESRPERKRMILCSIVAGILILMRSEVQLFFGGYGLWLFFKMKYRPALVLGLGIILCLSPWIIRNQLEFGKPVLSANLGINLYRGNNPGALGDWPPQDDPEVRILKHNPASFELLFDEHCLHKALDWIRENPDRFLSRLPEKFFRFWVLDWPDPRTHTPVYWVPWFLTLTAGIFGLTHPLSGRLKPEWWLFISYSLIVLIFFPQVRYLTLIRFFWMPLAAVGLSTMASRFK